MNHTTSELKGIAREALAGRYALPVCSLLLITIALALFLFTYSNLFLLASGSLGSFLYHLGQLIILLLALLAGAGVSLMLLRLARGQAADFSDICSPFTLQGDRIIITTLIKVILYFFCMVPASLGLLAAALEPGVLWLRLLTLILFLAGIVFAVYLQLTYALTVYICLDEPDTRSLAVLAASRSLMQGHRFRLFYLQVSFIGLELLCSLSAGLALLWLAPYMEMTRIEFYRELKKEI